MARSSVLIVIASLMSGCASVDDGVDTADTQLTDGTDGTDGTDDTDDTGDTGDTGDVEGNDPPVFTSEPPLDAIQGVLWVYPGLAEDPDADELSWTLTDAPSGMEINEWGLVTWTPPADVIGAVDVEVAVSDGVHA
ncbi:MAG: hypothetical protein AB8H79_14200, partial [Myxococcota bacterium]